MNKFILKSISCMLFLSCGVKLNTGDLIYKEGVTFKAERIIKAKGKEQGNVNYFAPKGTHFIQLHLTFENKTNLEQIVDPEDIFLLDDRNNKYSVDMVAQGITTNPFRIKEHRLKAGQSKRFLMGFDYGFPQDSKIRILVLDKIYNL